tara:strand:- start:41643 stop:42683 length:1041 start_codon:yes stop_codon:yes gene_type:complete
MHLGLFLGYSGATYSIDIKMIQEAESLGYSSVWTSEAYGSDSVTPAAWILAQTENIKVGTAIIQIPARTPACAAMTAMTLQSLSKNRFILGVGPSGPQVIEGWHGESYDRPLTRMREYIEIIRDIFKRESPLEYDGYHYQLPYRGDKATGLGKPLESILHPVGELEIFTAAVAPKGIQLAAEIADGMFPIFMAPERFDIFQKDLEIGFAKSKKVNSINTFKVSPIVPLVVGEDIALCRRPVKSMLALYIGGMGAPGKNFYNDYAKRLGHEEAAIKIQKLYLTGNKSEAEESVPDELVDSIALAGPKEHIKERLQVWKNAAQEGKIDSLLISGGNLSSLRFLAELSL